jgi:hypothetical protein
VTSFIQGNFIITNNFAATIYDVYFKLIPATCKEKQQQNLCYGYKIYSSSEGETKNMELKTKFLKHWNSLFVKRVRRETITMAWVGKGKT